MGDRCTYAKNDFVEIFEIKKSESQYFRNNRNPKPETSDFKIKTSPSKSFETGEVGEVRVTVVRVASFEKKNPTIQSQVDINAKKRHTLSQQIRSLAHLHGQSRKQK
jgi:hypothetical protein